MKYRKQYVDVDVFINADGHMRPKTIHWISGERFEIECVKKITPAPALKAGGQGDRYTVIIENKERYLFFERTTETDDDALVGKWFVEAMEV